MGQFNKERAAGTVFLLLLFLAPGAYLITHLPEVPWAQLSCVVSIGLACFLVLSGVLPIRMPDKSVWIITALMTIPALCAWLVNPHQFQQALYDIYGDMPLVLWLLYPVVFLLCASLKIDRWVKTALKILAIVGLALLALSLWQRIATPWVTVFGSVAYSISAFVPLLPLMLWLAKVERKSKKRWFWLIATATSTLALAYISYGLLGILAAGAFILLTAALAPNFYGIKEGKLCTLVSRGALVSLLLMVLGFFLILTPATNQYIIKKDQLGGVGKNIRSRIELSYGAQRMFLTRPLLGYGPAGYRLNAVRYLDKELFADTASLGSDPLAYSPPSPHTLIWEVLTRLGLAGALAFITAAFLWWRQIRHLEKTEPHDIALLRRATAIATLSWLLTLMATPQHFASGFLGVACAGLTLASFSANLENSQEKKEQNLSIQLSPRAIRALVALLIIVAIAGYARQQLSIAETIPVVYSANADMQRLESSAKGAPHHPTIERRLLECQLLTCDTAEENEALLSEVLASPGYISDFGPNLVNFARLGMDNLVYFNQTDLSAVLPLLDKAETIMPLTPPLLGERVHAAIISGDEAQLQMAKEAFRPVEQLYPPGQEYLTRLNP